jgi:hypothetical protein
VICHSRLSRGVASNHKCENFKQQSWLGALYYCPTSQSDRQVDGRTDSIDGACTWRDGQRPLCRKLEGSSSSAMQPQVFSFSLFSLRYILFLSAPTSPSIKEAAYLVLLADLNETADSGWLANGEVLLHSTSFTIHYSKPCSRSAIYKLRKWKSIVKWTKKHTTKKQIFIKYSSTKYL